MKQLNLLIILWLMRVACFGQECVRPLVAGEFGNPVAVTAEFVAKPNTYYAQNIVKEPFLLRVISVDGRALKDVVVIEYLLEADSSEKKKLERAGIVQEFEAYETLYQPDFATPWLGEWEQGMSFALNHLLHIRTRRGSTLPSGADMPKAKQ